MGNARSGDLEGFLDDAEEFESADGADATDADARKRIKKPVKGPKTTAWRDIEDHNEGKRLKRALSEFYDDES